MEYQNILWEQQGGVGIITLNRPAALNALNQAHLIELDHAVQRAGFDPRVRSPPTATLKAPAGRRTSPRRR